YATDGALQDDLVADPFGLERAGQRHLIAESDVQRQRVGLRGLLGRFALLHRSFCLGNDDLGLSDADGPANDGEGAGEERKAGERTRRFTAKTVHDRLLVNVGVPFYEKMHICGFKRTQHCALHRENRRPREKRTKNNKNPADPRRGQTRGHGAAWLWRRNAKPLPQQAAGASGDALLRSSREPAEMVVGPGSAGLVSTESLSEAAWSEEESRPEAEPRRSPWGGARP